ncbi:MAG TPA: response regulator [Longimicrobium sp.]|nr:response regulator [Longimicrobium sp.]
MPRTILLAEDHEDNRFALLTVLQREGYAALGARNGREAVELAFEHSPDLIVMDLAMPVMDGREALRALKADARTRDIPVVALTAMSLTVSGEELEAEGFAALLTKPCMPPHLIGEVRRRIGPPEAEDLAEAGAP